jgi:hypothetical protein
LYEMERVLLFKKALIIIKLLSDRKIQPSIRSPGHIRSQLYKTAVGVSFSMSLTMRGSVSNCLNFLPFKDFRSKPDSFSV